jgi:hypothetical protein
MSVCVYICVCTCICLCIYVSSFVLRICKRDLCLCYMHAWAYIRNRCADVLISVSSIFRDRSHSCSCLSRARRTRSVLICFYCRNQKREQILLRIKLDFVSMRLRRRTSGNKILSCSIYSTDFAASLLLK